MYVHYSYARRTQTIMLRCILAEPYSVHNQIAYAMNDAELLCAGVWQLGTFFYNFDSRLVHMFEINRLCYKWLN